MKSRLQAIGKSDDMLVSQEFLECYFQKIVTNLHDEMTFCEQYVLVHSPASPQPIRGA